MEEAALVQRMPYKFKVGDLVKVKKVAGMSEYYKEEKEWIYQHRIGKVARIKEVNPGWRETPYFLDFKSKFQGGGLCEAFAVSELGKVEDTYDYRKEELLGKIKQLWDRQEYVKAQI